MDIRYFNVDVYLRSKNSLVSVSGQNDPKSFLFDSDFVIRISEGDWPIVRGFFVDSLDYICRDHRIIEIDNLHGFLSDSCVKNHVCVRP